LQLYTEDLSLTLLASQTFHLICSPTRANSMVTKILSRRQEQGITQEPMFLWEPVPGVCTTDDWKDCIEVMKVVDVISPNVNETAGFLGQTIDEDQPFERFKECVEKVAKKYTSHQIGNKGAVVIRCGKHGCLVATPSTMRWLPAYHQTIEKVVDPTGGGNAFCGGFCAGWSNSEGDFITAAMYGSVAASFIIEQFGLPQLEYDKNGERWNGDTIERRMNLYKSLCKDINN
jgi:sugar/nucleoside kinase (ribokinase family)